MLPTSRITIPPHIYAQKLSDDTVLLNAETGAYFGLTTVASRAWELLAQGAPMNTVPGVLESEFDAPREQIESDLAAFFTALQDKQLIHF